MENKNAEGKLARYAKLRMMVCFHNEIPQVVIEVTFGRIDTG